jgi:dihydrodipicolinate synthase/N-acetylneuraminate lyase
MIGCTSTYTLGAARRAAYAAQIGADAIQVALPYWMEIGCDQIAPFFKEVVRASGGLPLSIYETARAKRTFTVEQHRAIKEAAPCYLMVKANAGTVGCTPEGCRALSEFVNVFVGENRFGQLGPFGAKGSCSSIVYWNPRLILELWRQVEQQDWASVEAGCRRLDELLKFLEARFGPRGFTDTAFDRLGGVAGNFLKTSLRSRGPYPSPTTEDVETLRRWYGEHLPEMLRL